MPGPWLRDGSAEDAARGNTGSRSYFAKVVHMGIAAAIKKALGTVKRKQTPPPPPNGPARPSV